jgi:Ubiquitin interaction motif
MDVTSSDLYGGDRDDSDDSLPDAASLFTRKPVEKKGKENRLGNPEVGGKTFTRTETSNESVSRINSFIQQTTAKTMQQETSNRTSLTASWKTQYTKPQTGQTNPAATPRSRFPIDLDPNLSSSPLARPSMNRAQTFNASTARLSSPVPAARPLHRASTYSDPHLSSSPLPNYQRHAAPAAYHEISDDDDDMKAAIALSLKDSQNSQPTVVPDDDLEAAIQASIAEANRASQTTVNIDNIPLRSNTLTSQPKNIPPKPTNIPSKPTSIPSRPTAIPSRPVSTFRCPDDLLNPPPRAPQPPATARLAEPRHPITPITTNNRPPPSSAVISADTRKMLDMLDTIATNSLKRKSPDAEAPKKKKPGPKPSENTNPKPKRTTQEVKVLSPPPLSLLFLEKLISGCS